MKILLKESLFACLICNLFLTAGLSQSDKQVRSGKIDYVFVNRVSLYTPGRADIVDTTSLYFNDTASSYYIPLRIPSKQDMLKQAEGRSASYKSSMITILQRMEEKQKRHFIYHKGGSNRISQPWNTPLGDTWYCLEDTIPAFTWQLLPDTARILGFLCQKASFRSPAIGGMERDFIAWFTPDIAYPYGPFRFFGLPGMILQLENTYYSYRAVAIDIPITEKGKVSIACCSGLPVISKGESEKIRFKQIKDNEDMKKLRSDKN